MKSNFVYIKKKLNSKFDFYMFFDRYIPYGKIKKSINRSEKLIYREKYLNSPLSVSKNIFAVHEIKFLPLW